MSVPALNSHSEHIIAEATRWLGTPYQHQASLRGHGADCLGLVRGIWRYLYGAEPETLPAYTPNWAEQHGQETLYLAAKRHLTEISVSNAAPGDVILFRMAPNSPAKHTAILVSSSQIIHAYWGRAVSQSQLRPFWAARQAYAFRFPVSERVQ